MIFLCSLPSLTVCLLSPESGFFWNSTDFPHWVLLTIRLMPIWQSFLCFLFCFSAQWFITKSMLCQRPQSAPHLLLITVPPAPLTAFDFYDNHFLAFTSYTHIFKSSHHHRSFFPGLWNHLCQTSFTQHCVCELQPLLLCGAIVHSMSLL